MTKWGYCHICKKAVELAGDECSECAAYLGYLLDEGEEDDE